MCVCCRGLGFRVKVLGFGICVCRRGSGLRV